MASTWDLPANLDRAERLVRQAAGQGAQVVLMGELFATPHFCQDQLASFFDLARPFQSHPVLLRFADLARELGVVLPVSFFERSGPTFYNSVTVIDADGAMLGIYRESHIPDGPGYAGKFYFSPGDTGFQAWDTAVGRIGVGIGWDQWFPESARAMALKGAEILLYPTAMSATAPESVPDRLAHWRRVLQGQAAANMMPVVAANRIGLEEGREGTSRSFCGGSFVAGPWGEILAEADDASEAVILAKLDLETWHIQRSGWGLFRDRRPDLYRSLLSLDGRE
ncbi:MAG TPA: nitrilase-related carbon-nitrogen hydrolase [Acidisoma sp.]|uniref:nitrilase-related carbon-nitrogen hydrolase n=1 Tax=Acidisoma sp. TaxID=1872115 RepID=UPI002B7853DC|nr:nitrilase-related carbon-nitrogen hydrolase [Acidisoma sp.]HTI00187.1 nitrilase-related carbon-nitrogen hydrolase [Acidisoma sp.]